MQRDKCVLRKASNTPSGAYILRAIALETRHDSGKTIIAHRDHAI